MTPPERELSSLTAIEPKLPGLASADHTPDTSRNIAGHQGQSDADVCPHAIVDRTTFLTDVVYGHASYYLYLSTIIACPDYSTTQTRSGCVFLLITHNTKHRVNNYVILVVQLLFTSTVSQSDVMIAMQRWTRGVVVHYNMFMKFNSVQKYDKQPSVLKPQSHRACDQVTTYQRPKNVGIVTKS